MPSAADLPRLAGELVAAAGPAGGTLAQLADLVDPAWIPEEHHDTGVAVLAALRRATPEPLTLPEVERALRDAWGGRLAEHVAELDPEPAAPASSGQVHRARLPDGRAVAVKLLRPGSEPALRRALDLLGTLAPLVAQRLPEIDVAAWVREGRERLLDELDLEHEASTLRTFARAYRGHPHVLVPSPVSELCTPTTLVCDWIDGTPFDAVCGLEPDARDRYGEILARAFLGAPLHLGLLHADPHPGNHRLGPDGRVVLLDLGASGPVAPETMAAHVDDALPRLRRLLPWLDDPDAVRLSPELLAPLVDDPAPAREALRAIDPPPSDFQLGRMLGSLALVLLRLEAAAPWGALLAELSGDGGPATELGERDAAFWERRGGSRRHRVLAARRT